MHIDYNKSLLIRGLAILGMIWLHCFNLDPYGVGYQDVAVAGGGVYLGIYPDQIRWHLCATLLFFVGLWPNL